MKFQQTILLTLLALPILVIAQNPAIEHISPEGITAAPHFSPGITTTAEQTIYISGMTGQFNDNADALEEYETQLRQAYEKVGMTLNAAGATPQDVVRQRVLIVGISQEHAAITRKVMQEFYGVARPTSTATGTSGLFNPELVVEVDVTAVLAN
jgi:enamine deaminase RidA (YjgF/YER057c/UK114 family)